jgi:hypothetical protein
MKKLATKFHEQGKAVFFLSLMKFKFSRLIIWLLYFLCHMKFKFYELCFFRLNVNILLVFIFILLLSYHTIRVFLV